MHSLASLSGKYAVGESARAIFDNLEEFAAIVITNVFISETAGQQLMGGHHGEMLPAALMPSQAFYDPYKEPLQRVCRNYPSLVRGLRTRTDISHNPFVCCEM
jgi:hypothetical protein